MHPRQGSAIEKVGGNGRLSGRNGWERDHDPGKVVGCLQTHEEQVGLCVLVWSRYSSLILSQTSCWRLKYVEILYLKQL